MCMYMLLNLISVVNTAEAYFYRHKTKEKQASSPKSKYAWPCRHNFISLAYQFALEKIIILPESITSISFNFMHLGQAKNNHKHNDKVFL